MSINYPNALLTCQYHILGPRCDDDSKVKVYFFLELFCRKKFWNGRPTRPPPSPVLDKFQIEMENPF